ncbi:MAG TPA: diphosphate--fructose-6-phosphate 1-phosphotransferase [Anaerolineae bacterium]|nr:diphosphate--fructose-6-phosphate 1-phosphotransferase [Anaerolineae bacterium]HQK14728.1 diphosphate--fructose-6-phosphate 1-phosphotransferase [Anaerolineae bacterium]
MNKAKNKKLGILVGGGPAPGINGVIHSAVIEASVNGMEVIGLYEGFKYLMQGRIVGRPLTIADVSRIHRDGGSILRTSRANPTKSDRDLETCSRTLIDAGINCLLAIGGDDTAYSAYRIARYADEHMNVRIQTVHAPKTIDNDLPLPEGIVTFGFETARELGTRLVMNLMEDALTSQRWYLVVAMGRKAGHLALGIGKSSGATITLIPEEWGNREIRLQEVIDILTTTIIKRQAEDKPHGVAVVAEGVVEQMYPGDLEGLENVERDAHGHIRLSEVNFSDILKDELRKQLKDLGVSTSIINIDMGYELRCADPIAYDIDYTRSLGEAAVAFLLNDGSHATITIQQGQMIPIPFDKMMDPTTGRTEVRKVNVNSFVYRSACKFMIRLTPEDAEDEILLGKMAAQTNLSLDQFKARFGYLIGIAPRPF